jgi:hypothetical protein
MNLFGVIVLLFIVIAVVLFYRWYIKDQKEIVSEWDAGMNPKLIESDKLQLSTSQRYTFSVWIYLKQWTPKQNNRVIFQRIKGTSPANNIQMAKDGKMDDTNVYFHMELDKDEPTLRTYVHLSGGGAGECHIKNIPVQRWVNVIASVQGQIIDMYLDGKLHKHCEFKTALAEIPKETSIYIFGGSPIEGKISKLEYIKKDIRPQRAWEIYVDGPRDTSLIGNWLNRYMLRIQWLKDGTVEKEYKV